MDEKPEEKPEQQYGDPELNNEPEIPIIPAPEPDDAPEATPAPAYSPTSPKKRNPKKLLYLVGAIVVILVLFNAVRMLTGGSKTAAPTPTPSAVETPTPSPEASSSAEPTTTPAPTNNPVDSSTGLDRSKLSVAVENGSGEVGVGAKGASFLKNLGYNVVSTGNADNFNFTNVTIQVKASQKAYLPLLNKDLSTSYSVGTTSSDLSASSSADALVIIGK